MFLQEPAIIKELLDPPELREIQIGWVVYHMMGGYVACGHTSCDIPPIRFVFQVTQEDLTAH
jgi:hypothetical protein